MQGRERKFYKNIQILFRFAISHCRAAVTDSTFYAIRQVKYERVSRCAMRRSLSTRPTRCTSVIPRKKRIMKNKVSKMRQKQPSPE